MAAPKIAKQIRSNGNLASPICHDLAQRMRILSSRVLPNFHVGTRRTRPPQRKEVHRFVPTVAAMCVYNPDRSPVIING